MTRILVSTIGPEKTVDLKTVPDENDTVEAYKVRSPLTSRVRLIRQKESIFRVPVDVPWDVGDEVNILINYLADVG